MELHTKGVKLFKYEPFTGIFRSCDYCTNFFSHGESRAKLRTLHKNICQTVKHDKMTWVSFFFLVAALSFSTYWNRSTASIISHVCPVWADGGSLCLSVSISVTSLSRKKSTSMRMRFPLGLLLPLRFASASSACGSWRLNNLRDREKTWKRDGTKEWWK